MPNPSAAVAPLIVFRTDEPVVLAEHRQSYRNLEVVLTNQSYAFPHIVHDRTHSAATSVLESQINARRTHEPNRESDTSRYGILRQAFAVVGLVVVAVATSDAVGHSAQIAAHVEAVGGILESELEQIGRAHV